MEVPGRGTGPTPGIGRLRLPGEDGSPPWTSSQRSPSPPPHDYRTEHTQSRHVKLHRKSFKEESLAHFQNKIPQ